MTAFRVVYSRGSFAFAIACATMEQALARAISISREAGVWHVQVEDQNGKAVVVASEGSTMHRRPIDLSSPMQSASRQEMSLLPRAKRRPEEVPE